MIKAALNEVSATKADTTNFVLDGFVNKAAVAVAALRTSSSFWRWSIYLPRNR